MRNTDGGGSTLKSSKVAVVKVQNPELDVQMDPGQEEYFAQFLSSDSKETNKLPSFLFLQEAFPNLLRTFLRAEAIKIGSDQEKLADFINWINLQDESSLPQKVSEENQEKVTGVDLENVLRMKPSNFLLEFLPSPDIFFSDESRVVSEEYQDHSYYYLATRYARRVRGGLAKIKRILQEKNYLLVPALSTTSHLPPHVVNLRTTVHSKL